MDEAHVEQVAQACRNAYGEHILELGLVPWPKSQAQEAWRVVARAAIKEIGQIPGLGK